MKLDFPIVKLLDFKARWDELEASTNPFAVLILAHLQTLESHEDATRRLLSKLSLVKSLYQKEFSKKDILEIYRFIDWLMVLPEDLAEKFDQEITSYEETLQMPYITSTERAGIKKGFQQGEQIGMQKGEQIGMQKGEQIGIQKGEQIGIQKGEQIGIQKGVQIAEVNLLKRLLSRRFGVLPENVAQRLDAASPADLELWFERGLDAKALSEVFH